MWIRILLIPRPGQGLGGLLELEDSQETRPGWILTSENDQAVLGIRNLVLDVCMQNGGGHGGSALGMAATGVALWKHVMRYNPNNTDWFDRDRLVLSNSRVPPQNLSCSPLADEQCRPCEHISLRRGLLRGI